MKKLFTTLLLVAGVATNVQAKDSLASSMQNASISGQFRAAYISVSPDGATDTKATALGGEIKLETAPWINWQFAITPYFSEKVDFLSGDADDGELNTDFFEGNGDSFAYLGEAYAQYNFASGAVRVGRQQLDNPFINTDDIRMFPNTFAAAWVTLELSKAMNLEVGKVNTWAGFDSGDDQGDFKEVGDDGAVAIGVTYAFSETLNMQAWSYDFDGAYSIFYVDGSYATGDWGFATQYASFDEDNGSGVDGSVIGFLASYSTGPWTFSAALNTASNDDGKGVDNGLGGGNFFTSMDEMTIAGLNDAEAYVFGAEYAFNDDLTAGFVYGHFEDDGVTLADIDEINITVGYTISENLDVGYTHVDVDNDAAPSDPDTNFTRQLIRATYTF